MNEVEEINEVEEMNKQSTLQILKEMLVSKGDAKQKLILLDQADNVFVCCQSLALGESVDIGGNCFVVSSPIELGHKIARFALASGDRVFKYGVPIGSMVKDVGIGAHIHLHNMKSDYIASHTREGKNGA